MEIKKITAEEARELQIQTRLEEHRSRADVGGADLIAPPIVVDAFIQPGNLATKDILANGFEIIIPEWARVEKQDRVDLFINNLPVYNNPIITIPDPAPKEVPEFRYRLEPYYLGGYQEDIKITYRTTSRSLVVGVSNALVVRVDRSPPGQKGSPEALQFPADMNNKVTLKYLDDHENQVIATVPAYEPMEVGQTVIVWWNGKKTTAISPVTVEAKHVADKAVPIVIPGAQIRGSKDERVILQYSLTSRAGFEGAPSEMSIIEISLDPEPVDLPDPIVPLAADGEIDLTDADKGVEIRINAYKNAINGDSIVAYWGGSSLSAEAVIATNFPIYVPVPRSVVLAEDSGNIPVYYEVRRVGSVTKSNTIQVKVDVRTVGPVDPHPSTPVNEALQPPVIQGGSKSYPKNELRIKDLGKPATATIPFFQSAQGTMSAPIITQPGAQITLMWGAWPNPPIHIGPMTVTESDLQAKTFPDIVIPSAIVDTTADNDALEVYYVLSRPDTDKPLNPVSSPSSSVVVEMNVPGGPEGLHAPIIMGANSANWLVKASVKPGGVNIKIAPYPGMKVNDIVELHWVSYSTDDNTPGTEIDLTEYKQSIIVTNVQMTYGMEYTVPYAPYIERILPATGNRGIGSGMANYTVTQNGKPYTSRDAVIQIDLTGPGG